MVFPGFCLEYLVVVLPFSLRRNTCEGEAHLFCLGYIDFEMPVKCPCKNV